MADFSDLERFCEQRFFQGWDDFVDKEHVNAAEASLQSLIAELRALGPGLSEVDARQAVDKCVGRFNDMDDG